MITYGSITWIIFGILRKEKIAAFLKKYQLDHVGVFTYSNEKGCRAEHLPEHLPEDVKQERYKHLMEIQSEISLQKNSELIGKTIPVLVEGISQESDLLLEGRSTRQAPEIDGCIYINEGNCNIGDIVQVTISEAHPYDLVGRISTDDI